MVLPERTSLKTLIAPASVSPHGLAGYILIAG
jgi:hypothetical protein